MTKVLKIQPDSFPSSDYDENSALHHKDVHKLFPIESLSGADKLIKIEKELCCKLQLLHFGHPVEYVYNPLEYASDLHNNFLRKFLKAPTKKILFLGMNPGPWGMCQNGIPFGEKDSVKEWFQVTGTVGHPSKEHPSRLIKGLDCHRSEVSGKRFWGLFKSLCGTPENFFKHSFIYNICPLAFLTNTAKNVTPAELKADQQKPLQYHCNEAFIKVIKELKVEIVIGIGKFAEKSATVALKNSTLTDIKVVSIPHPSPRNAKNNTNWNEATISVLTDMNLIKYFKTTNLE